MPGLAPEHIHADVGGDPVEPGPVGRRVGRVAGELLTVAPRPQERLLYRVLRLVEGREHPVAVDVQFAAMLLGELLERRLVGTPDVLSLRSCSTQVLPSGPLKATNGR